MQIYISLLNQYCVKCQLNELFHWSGFVQNCYKRTAGTANTTRCLNFDRDCYEMYDRKLNINIPSLNIIVCMLYP